MKNCSSIVVIVGLASFTQASTADTLITFDDLATNRAPIPNGYGGLRWSNMDLEDTSISFAENGANSSGYLNAAVSGTNVAYNNFADPGAISVSSPNSFDLTSGYFTAAWNDGLNVLAQGYLNGVLEHTTTFTVNTSGPTLEIFGWKNVNGVTFTSFGGTWHAGFSGSGAQFALDNLTVSTVPIPAAAFLFPSALGLLGWRRRGGLNW